MPSQLVMAGLILAIPTVEHFALLIEIAGTSPAMTAVLPLGIEKHSARAVGCGIP